jgi:hypothetical protein
MKDHEYDVNAWQAELTTLIEAKQILLATEVSNEVFTEIDAHIEDLRAYLKYGVAENGLRPNYPTV